ncbi:acetolactate synthase-1/2/3 large subunit [Kibdelosporangium banguiense]|uniref:Acetolactate synthase-1/2/3 large subunit n=1 Tax=Kibdelosporangium banguiense TaxID=1365924 RepID=A0ABS4U0F7_9PSEU|nr:thiamine pyrophosphate-binding protein [Kibdelosporangium banguiense]MBP2330130.1 acetolactate synthase-1/2/3 large subunit [Kibdelosporangium banguiense]
MSRTGGDLVVESLTALGAQTVFGLPGQHALGLFDALRRSSLRYVGSRTEVNAAFAADGYARMTRSVTPLFVSTGPGALQTLAGLQEAVAASVPVFGISSQIPSAGLGGARRGFLHELPDQRASFRDIVKHTRVVRSASQIPSAIAEAWQIAACAPTGPVWLEIPQDILLADTDIPAVTELSGEPRALVPRPELIAEACRLLSEASRPVVLAGGGVVRGGAEQELLALAEKLGTPVVTTFGGRGAFAWQHPLSLQSWVEDWHTTEVLQDADILLVVGSGLGELSSNYHTFAPRGRVIQIEADLGKLESNHPALGIHSDAALALRALVSGVAQRTAPVPDLLPKIQERLDSQDLKLERDVLAAVREALPDDAPSFWDMTILSYWAWSAWDPRGGAMNSAQGSGGLGYAYPAALGAASTVDGPVLAVSGDGGAMYGISELATARQHNLRVTWLIVDDGGYGILREYMTGAFGEANGTELARPDFVALAESFGVPATLTSPERLRADLAKALSSDGPQVVVLPALLRMFAPTHLEQQ